MTRPNTPSINVEDTSEAQPPAQTSLRSNNNRPRSTASSERAIEEAPWSRPSIRIRRLPSNQAIQRARAASLATGPGNEYRGVQRLTVTAGPAAAPPTPGTDGLLTVEAPSSSATRSRSRSGSGSNRLLGHENRTVEGDHDGDRRRSISDPPQMHWESLQGAHERGAHRESYMPAVQEGTATTDTPTRPPNAVLQPANADQTPDSDGYFGMGRRMSNAARATSSRFFPAPSKPPTRTDTEEEQYEADMVDVLDTLDPEISTLNTLTNVQNSLFIPDLGRYLNRRPTYTLTRPATAGTAAGTIKEEPIIQEIAEEIVERGERPPPTRAYTMTSMTSRLDESHFAVLPHGERLEGWSAEDRAELNDHVRHLLHSRKEKFRRGWKGFRQYVRKPLGFFVTVYATLITLFGLAWVLFLIGWINVGGRKDYLVNVIDNVLVALFAIMGDGLAPFRAIDTYHMSFIAHYHHLTWRLRREQKLPKLQNHNDLPGLGPSWETQPEIDAEAQEESKEAQAEYSVLNPRQQKRLVHHQKKFSRSHTFYKPHETTTHFAFPLRHLVAIVVLLDCHSCLQIALGTCTWAISYHVRPFALTTVILCCSITCNITAGVLISIGDKRSRKKDVLERMFRQELTAQAMELLQKRKENEAERNELLEVPGADLATPAPLSEKEEEAGPSAGNGLEIKQNTVGVAPLPTTVITDENGMTTTTTHQSSITTTTEVGLSGN